MALFHTMAEQMHDRGVDYLRFTVDGMTSFGNNVADCEVWMINIRQNISDFLSSLYGAQGFCAVYSHVVTAVKYSVGIFQAPACLAKGEYWTPKTT